MKIKLSSRIHLYSVPKEIRKTIKDDLTVKNPVWISNHKMGRYNFKTEKYLEMFSDSQGRLSVPSGYLEEILWKISKEGIVPDIYDLRVEKPASFKFTGRLRQIQIPACQNSLEYDNGVIEAATGAGKTVMALYLIYARKQKSLVIVHTKDLAHQWIKRSQQFLGLKTKEIGLIGDGRNDIGSNLTIGLVQSIYKQIGKLSRQFGHIIVDEAHRTPSRTFTEAVNGFFAKYYLGLSATPYRRDGLTELIFWHLGPKRHTVSKKQLYEEGHIVQPIFIIRGTEFVPHSDPIHQYSKMMSELTKDDQRNDLIVSDIQGVGDENNCLILTDRKEHCYLIQNKLHNVGIKALVITGETGAKRRKDILSRIGKSNRYLIATGQLIGEGFDCKNLNVMFLTTPIKFHGRVTQYIGRVMRPAPGKDRPAVFDYADWNVGPLKRAAQGRIEIYGSENVIQY